MGKCLFELGHTEDGITLCEEAISMDPNVEKPYFFLAEIMHKNQGIINAINYLKDLQKDNPHNINFSRNSFVKKMF